MTGEQSDLPDRLPLAHIESTIASVRKMVMMGALFVIVGHLLIIGALGLELTEFHPLLEEFFASLEVAGVGAFEQDMRADGREYATNTYRYEDTVRGQAMKTDGFVKVIVDIIGPDAASLIQEVVVAMNAGSGIARDIRDAVHVRPAPPEVVRRAFSGRFSRGNDHHRHQH